MACHRPVKAAFAAITLLSFAKSHLGLLNTCGTITAMTDPKRLAAYVVRRREERAWSQIDVWRRGGPSNSTLTKIESGDWVPFAATLRKLDAGLGWRLGSAQAVLDGGEPTLAPDVSQAAPASARGESAAGSSSSSGGGVVPLPASVVEGLSEAELDEVQSVARAAALRRAREIAAARREAEALPDFSQMAARTVKRRPQWDEAQDGSDAGEESQE